MKLQLPAAADHYTMGTSLLVAIILIAMTGGMDAGVAPPSPTWRPAPYCAVFHPYQATSINSLYTEVHGLTTVQQCRERCAYDVNCGSISYRQPGECQLHRVSTRLLREYDLPPEIFENTTHSSYTSESLACAPQVNDHGCTDYPVFHNRTYIKRPYLMEAFYVRPEHSLSMDQCKTLCNIFTDCESVSYWRDGHMAECDLFNTTVTKLQAQGLYDQYGTNPLDGQLPLLINFERYCGDQPYDPNNYVPAVTTTFPLFTSPTPVNPSDPCHSIHPVSLSDLHGWYLCAGLGSPVSEEECNSRGCCYVRTTSIHSVLCVRRPQ